MLIQFILSRSFSPVFCTMTHMIYQPVISKFDTWHTHVNNEKCLVTTRYIPYRRAILSDESTGWPIVGGPDAGRACGGPNSRRLGWGGVVHRAFHPPIHPHGCWHCLCRSGNLWIATAQEETANKGTGSGTATWWKQFERTLWKEEQQAQAKQDYEKKKGAANASPPTKNRAGVIDEESIQRQQVERNSVPASASDLEENQMKNGSDQTHVNKSDHYAGDGVPPVEPVNVMVEKTWHWS